MCEGRWYSCVATAHVAVLRRRSVAVKIVVGVGYVAGISEDGFVCDM
jgi:hypothetical protein